MRIMIPNEKQEISATILTNVDDPAVRAVSLLQEALNLLGHAGISPAGPPDRLLRLPEVQRLTGLGRSAIYQQMKDGHFPRSVKAGPRASTWSEMAVQSWIRGRLSMPCKGRLQ